MKRKIVYLIVAFTLILSLSLAACAKEQTPTEAVTQPPVVPTVVPTEIPTVAPHILWTPELKQAIAAAIDREVIVDRVFEGRNIPAYSMVPAGYPYATEPFLDKFGTRDLEMSKSLLTKNGYSAENPFTFEIWYPPEHYGTTTADVIQVLKEQLEETGMIKVETKVQNWAEYVDSFVAGEIPFFILGWFPDFVDPDTWLTPFASTIQSPDNGIFYSNPIMDDLLQRAAGSPDPAERESLYKEIGVLFAEDIPAIPLFWEPEFITSRPGIEGIAIGAPFEFNYNVLSFGPDAKPVSGNTDTIIIGTTDEVNSLDAHDAYSTHDWEIIKNTGVPLMKYLPGMAELVPGTASAAPTVSEDGKVYTFILREGIKFADGTPLTAQDYVYGWNRLNTLEGQVSGVLQAYVEKVEAPDDLTVVVTLKHSVGFLPALAAMAPFVAVNKATFPADSIVAFPEKIDGTGPYKMVSHVTGQQMVLEANPNYFGEDKAKIKTVIIKYFQDPMTMANAVEKGEIDIAWRVLGSVEAARLMTVQGLTVTKVDAPALRFLAFNCQYMTSE